MVKMIVQCEATIRKFLLFRKEESVLVGVSGGPDSLALLLALVSMKKEFGLKLHVAHFDHNVRKSSGQDVQFVKDFSFQLGIPCSCGKMNKDLSQYGLSEERARKERYDFLFSVAKKIGTRTIALGHNRDDQAETVLMRLVRGAGLQGLSAMMPSRQMGYFRIVRPLIETSRHEINAYLRYKNVVPRIDETNDQDIYFRNKIRKILLPLLESKFNNNIKEVLSNTASTIGQDYDYLDLAAEKMYRKIRGRLWFRVLKNTHPALLRLLIRKAIISVQGDTRRITFVHIREIEDLIHNRPVGSIVNLPQGVSVIKKKHWVSFSKL